MLRWNGSSHDAPWAARGDYKFMLKALDTDDGEEEEDEGKDKGSGKKK